jgi:hypothetical protein
MNDHLHHLQKYCFYFDPNINKKQIKSLSYQIKKHKGTTTESSKSPNLTHIIVVNEVKLKTKELSTSKQLKLLHSTTLVQLALTSGLTALTLEEFDHLFDECNLCKEEKYNQIKAQIVLEKTTGKFPGLPFILVQDIPEKFTALMKVFNGVSEIPKMNFSAPLGYCAIQSTHNTSTKNEYRYCECCQVKYLDQTKV